MNSKTLTMILAVVLIASFFLPIGKAGPSMFDAVQAKGGDWQKYLFLIFPICGLLLLIGSLNNNYFISRSLLTWLPFLVILLILFILPLVNGSKVNAMLEQFKSFGLGMWLAIVGSTILAFYNPRA